MRLRSIAHVTKDSLHFSKRKYSLIVLAVLFCSFCKAQDTVRVETYRMGTTDTLTATDRNPVPVIDTQASTDSAAMYKKRKQLITYGSIGVYGGMLLALNQAWYAQYKRSSFHTFNDNKEWQQVDKAGHAWSAYQLSRLTYSAWKWAGASEKKSILLSAISGPGFLTVIETLDGFSSEWGWSWGDMGANVFGGGMFALQQLAWHEQRVDYKFSFHPVGYGSDMLSKRADNLYGSSFPERLLKDYNGQTYWLSANLQSFFKKSNLPAWLNVAVGYGANGMFGATENIGKDNQGNINFDRRDIPRYRQWFLSPDIKWSKIKTKSKFVKAIFYLLDGIKFPLPGLELSQGKMKLRGLLF